MRCRSAKMQHCCVAAACACISSGAPQKQDLHMISSRSHQDGAMHARCVHPCLRCHDPCSRNDAYAMHAEWLRAITQCMRSMHALNACAQCMRSMHALNACSMHAINACAQCMLNACSPKFSPQKNCEARSSLLAGSPTPCTNSSQRGHTAFTCFASISKYRHV